MNIRVIVFTTLLLVLLGACDNFDPQSYVPGLETSTPVLTQETSSPVPASSFEPFPKSAATEAHMLKVCTNIVAANCMCVLNLAITVKSVAI